MFTVKRSAKRICILIGIVVFLLCGFNTYAAETTESTMLNKINALRAENGLPELKSDSELASYAKIRAEEISKKWSHTRPNGTEGLDLIPLSKSYAGENLSKCTENGNECDEMFTALVNSPSHLENMIAPEYTSIGIATYESNGTVYVAYMFSN